jgi:hypothetical protein
VEGQALGYLPLLEDLLDALLGGLVLGVGVAGTLPPRKHVFHYLAPPPLSDRCARFTDVRAV